MTTNQPVDPIGEAETVLANLVAKRDAVLNRKDAVAEEMRSRGFAAHAEGDAPSQKRLRELSQETLLLDGELAALEGAIAEGRSRLAGARRLVEREALVAKVAAAREMIGPLRKAGADVTRHLGAFVLAYGELRALTTQLRRAGVGKFVRHDIFDVLARQAIAQILRPHNLSSEPIIVQGGRRELQALVERTIADFEHSLARALNGGADTVEAEQVEEAAE